VNTSPPDNLAVASATAGRRYELEGPGRGHVVQTDFPEPGVGEVLVQVHANGVCASDLPTWVNKQSTYPVSLGHEPVGTVVAVGSGVDLAVGIRVTGRLVPSFADYVLGDIRDVVPVPDGVPTEQAIGEPLGCVVEGLRRTRVHMADRVAVVGLGFMGLCMVQLLAASGTARVTAIDLRYDARQAALGSGANDAHDPRELPANLLDQTRGFAGDKGFDVVVEASGTQPGLDLATELVRPHGAISILGYHQGRREVDVQAWNWKALDVVNAHVRDRDLLRESTRVGLEMIAAGRIDLGPLLTHRYLLERLDDAFEALRAKPPGFIKALVINQ
jgi:threonine dehydrogenase-like Zn-dependent dehydrogenase